MYDFVYLPHKFKEHRNTGVACPSYKWPFERIPRWLYLEPDPRWMAGCSNQDAILKMSQRPRMVQLAAYTRVCHIHDMYLLAGAADWVPEYASMQFSNLATITP